MRWRWGRARRPWSKPTARELLDRIGDYAASTDDQVDMLAARVERVLELHKAWCPECLRNGTCPTVQTLDGETLWNPKEPM